MRFLWYINKATDIHPEYVILIAYPRQQQLRERVSLLLYTTLPVLLRNHAAFAEVQRSRQRSCLYTDLLTPLPSVEVLSDALPSIPSLCNTRTTSTCSPQSWSRAFKPSSNQLNRLSTQKWLCGWKECLYSSEALSKNIYAVFSLSSFESFYFPSQEISPTPLLFQPIQLAKSYSESLC